MFEENVVSPVRRSPETRAQYNITFSCIIILYGYLPICAAVDRWRSLDFFFFSFPKSLYRYNIMMIIINVSTFLSSAIYGERHHRSDFSFFFPLAAVSTISLYRTRLCICSAYTYTPLSFCPRS